MKHAKTLLTPLLAAALLIAGCTQEPDKQTIADAPPPTPDPIVEPPADNVGDRIFFDFDKAVLREDAVAMIEMQADWLTRHPDYSTMIEGHADERGTREYNLGLGCRRAVAMRDALILRGIAPERLGTISYGKERPAVLGANEDAWAQNRRAVMVVMNQEATPTLNCGER
jgi:peptidoglycan-associated lipoprotein